MKDLFRIPGATAFAYNKISVFRVARFSNTLYSEVYRTLTRHFGIERFNAARRFRDNMIQESLEKLRKRLIKLRTDKGISQLNLCENAGLSQSYYAELESPFKLTNPSTTVLLKLANALSIGICDIICDIDSDYNYSTSQNAIIQKAVIFRNYIGHGCGDCNKIINEFIKLMESYRYDSNDIEQIHICFNELYSNAWYHGNKEDPERPIYITFYMTHEDVRISITDEGEGFNYGSLPNPANYENLIQKLTSEDERVYGQGHGIFVVREYMDNLRYNKKGNSVEITKFNSNITHEEHPVSTLQRMTLSSWSELAEYRDMTTSNHLKRMPHLVRMIGTELAKNSTYTDYLTPGYLSDLQTASVLHDIGKVGISDNILLKKGKLTKMEFNTIKQHVTIGGNFINKMKSEWKRVFPNLNSYFDIASNIALYHHERWNGSGYINGLKHTNIPLSARLVSVADVYDALTNNRPYRKAEQPEKAASYIKEQSGSQFDPKIVKAFLNIFPSIKKSL